MTTTATRKRQFSKRYVVETNKLRGTATRPGDIAHGFTRRSHKTGRLYDFTRMLWADGSVSVTVREGGTTTVLHEFSNAVPEATVTPTERPKFLPLAVKFEGRGWKSFQPTGTRHAYYLLRKLAADPRFAGARLDLSVPGMTNIITLTPDDVTGSDSHGKYRMLLDRSNTHYDLNK
jgi:hypothetical protein